MSSENTTRRANNFLREIIAGHMADGTHGHRIATRFPPEPNGYPHLGHAQTICLNFGLAKEFGGTCNLRYDDTNPETEDTEFVAALEDAVRWLGFDPAEICFASDYFEQFYAWAVELVEKDLAYVDSQSGDDIRKNRGTVTQAGVDSRYRTRPSEESVRLLAEMRRGEHPDGSHVLRAKIDMANDNMLLRDPLMYRIRRDAHHYRRGSEWSIYPLYDWAHGQGDAIERITHSICTLEFDVHRPLYDWFLDAIGIEEPRNHQYEFARFNLDYTVMSKRKLRSLVEDGHVRGWDDPRMPTIAAQKRRGVRPEAIRAFFDQVGITKVDGSIDLAFYEHAIRDDLNHIAPRVMAVSNPLGLVIENLPADETTWIDAPYWPHDVEQPDGAPATRRVPLTRELWIEQDDFAEVPPKGWRRLSPGTEVRLRYGFVVRCTGVEKNADGEIITLRGEADLATLNAEPEGRKVPGVIHWVDAEHALTARFRLYDRLFAAAHPDEEADVLSALNPDSLVETEGFVEPSIAEDLPKTRYQFERLGYFWQDPEDSKADSLVFNRIAALRDSWGKRPMDRKDQIRDEASVLVGNTSPRDPAAGLSAEHRQQFKALVGKGVGIEEAAVIAGEPDLAALFEATVSSGSNEADTGKLLVHHLRPALGERSLSESNATPRAISQLVGLLDDGTITSSVIGVIIEELVTNGGSPMDIVADQSLAAVRDDEALAPLVEEVLAEHSGEVERFRKGERQLLGFFTGRVMRRAGKVADARVVQTMLTDRLEK